MDSFKYNKKVLRFKSEGFRGKVTRKILTGYFQTAAGLEWSGVRPSSKDMLEEFISTRLGCVSNFRKCGRPVKRFPCLGRDLNIRLGVTYRGREWWCQPRYSG